MICIQTVCSEKNSVGTKEVAILMRTDAPAFRNFGISIRSDKTLASGSAADVILLLKSETVSKPAQMHILSRICEEISGNGFGAPFTAPELYSVAGALARNKSFSDSQLQKRLIERYKFHSGIMADLIRNPALTDGRLIGRIVAAQVSEPKIIDYILQQKDVDEATENQIARSPALKISTCYHLSSRPMYMSTFKILCGIERVSGEWLERVSLRENEGVKVIYDDRNSGTIARIIPAA